MSASARTEASYDISERRHRRWVGEQYDDESSNGFAAHPTTGPKWNGRAAIVVLRER